MSNAACRLKKMNPKKIAFGCVSVEVNGNLGRSSCKERVRVKSLIRVDPGKVGNSRHR